MCNGTVGPLCPLGPDLPLRPWKNKQKIIEDRGELYIADYITDYIINIQDPLVLLQNMT